MQSTLNHLGRERALPIILDALYGPTFQPSLLQKSVPILQSYSLLMKKGFT